MAIKTDIELKTQVDAVIKINGNREITPPLDNSIRTNFIDSKQNIDGKDATGGYAGLTLYKINFKNAANTFTSFLTNTNTAARTYTFPDKNITVAGTDDVAAVISDTAYNATSWNGVTTIAPSKNAVRDEFENKVSLLTGNILFNYLTGDDLEITNSNGGYDSSWLSIRASNTSLGFEADRYLNLASGVTSFVNPTGTITVPEGSGTLATQAYADSIVTGLWDDRGSFDASVNAYPSSGGSGTAGAILKGDIWTISVAGTLPTGQAVNAGDTVRALVDTPGNTQANWAIAEGNLGYTPVTNARTLTINGTAFDLSANRSWTVGDALVANPLSQFAATTSLQLKGVISDETGSGSLVFADTPTLITPVLGVASATSLSLSGTAGAGFINLINQSSTPATPASGISIYHATAGFSWVNSGGFTRSLTMPSANVVYTFPSATDTLAGLGTAQTFTAAQTFSSTINKITFTAPATAATLTLANNTTTSVTGGGTLGLGGFTLTVPATGTAVLGTGTANRLAIWNGTNDLSSSADLTYSSPVLQLSRSGTGATAIATVNTSAGTTSRAAFKATAADNTQVIQYGSGYTTAGLLVARLGHYTTDSNVGLLFSSETSSTKMWWAIGGTGTANEIMRATTTGVAVGLLADPTAWFEIGAGTTSKPPLMFNSGSLTTGGSIVAGNMEFLTDDYYLTITTGTARHKIARVLTGSATLDFPNTLAQTDSDLTITVTGAAVGDQVALGVPSTPLTGSTYTAFVSATDTVTVRFSVYGIAAKDPASGTFKVTVIKN